MKQTHYLILFFLHVALITGSPSNAIGQTGTLAIPFAQPASNAALHYQRALLFLNVIDRDRAQLLENPIWVVASPSSTEISPDLKLLLYEGKTAINAAVQGARSNHCDFGIDFTQHGAATMVPHSSPMLKLGRLLTLRGKYAESQGHWQNAAIIYFDGLRMGRHLAQQKTFIEVLAGIQILQNNYFALAHWAVNCPNHADVVRVFGLFESLAPDMVNPVRTYAHEASLLRTQFDQLSKAYPKGPWAIMVLEGLNEEIGKGLDQKKLNEQAMAACLKRGVPKTVFENKESFNKYLDHLEHISLRNIEASVTCMTLPPQARIERGLKIHEKYLKLMGPLGQETLLNPAEIGALFATQEAELVATQVVLAIAASKNKKGYPETLSDIRKRFGGQVLKSPYDGSDLVYQVSTNRDHFSLEVPELKVADFVLPAVIFNSRQPQAVSDAK